MKFSSEKVGEFMYSLAKKLFPLTGVSQVQELEKL